LERNLSDTNDNNRSSILVIDDDPGISTFIKQSLAKNGFKVFAFTDPIMALEDFKINCKTCGVILSDVRMPGMNGYELVKQAKQIDKDAKVVLMSAFEIQEKEFHNLLPDIKIDGFLQKPFSIQHLNDAVEKISRE
jgi:DNA-binding NtrC family response regulator